MSSDERRDKRVLASLKVMYKSATVTEFISKHSHDISAGGVFIRAKKPLSKGTLMKIDFRLEDDTPVIQGVGRVVWTREPADNSTKPPGMGIKFIKLDEHSLTNIQKIIDAKNKGEALTKDSIVPPAASGVQPESTSVQRDSAARRVKEGEMDSWAAKGPADDVANDQAEAPDDEVDIPSDDGGQDDVEEVTAKIDLNEERAKARVMTGPGGDRKADGANKRSAFPFWGIVVIAALVGLVIFFMVTGSKEKSKQSTSVVSEPVTATSTPAVKPAVTAPVTPEGLPKLKMSGPVTVTKTPQEAVLTIDGHAVTQLPGQLEADKKVVFEATLFGYQKAAQEVTPVAGQPVAISLNLEPASFEVTFESQPPGARVLVDGKRVGKTPVTVRRAFPAAFEYHMRLARHEEIVGQVDRESWHLEDGVWRLKAVATLVPARRVVPKPKPVAAPESAKEAAPESAKEAAPESAKEAAPESAKEAAPESAKEAAPESAKEAVPVPAKTAGAAAMDENPY